MKLRKEIQTKYECSIKGEQELPSDEEYFSFGFTCSDVLVLEQLRGVDHV